MVESVTASGLSPGPTTADAIGSSKLGKDEFLRLLMTQMANQDPTEPQSNEDFIAQLAQFAALESNQAMASQLESLLVATSAQNQMAAVQLVGKQVTIPVEKVRLQGGGVEDLLFEVRGPVDSVQWTITDKDGKVHTENIKGPFDAGQVPFSISTNLPDGEYSISATTKTADGEPQRVNVLARQRVDGISYEGEVPMLMIGGELVSMGDVIEVIDPAAIFDAGTDDASDDDAPSRIEIDPSFFNNLPTLNQENP